MPGPRYTLGGDQSLSQGGALGQSCALRSRPCGRVPGRARSLALEGFSQGGHTQASWEKMLPTRLCPVSHSLALVLLCLCRRLNGRSVASGLDSLLVAERWERLGALVCRSITVTAAGGDPSTCLVHRWAWQGCCCLLGALGAMTEVRLGFGKKPRGSSARVGGSSLFHALERWDWLVWGWG